MERLSLIRLKFYKKEGRWYADVPGSPEEDNLMVSLFPELLDKITSFRYPVEFFLSDDMPPEFKDKCRASLFREDCTENGATYKLENYGYPGLDEYHGKSFWVCPVIKKVFGDFPHKIYLYSDIR